MVNSEILWSKYIGFFRSSEPLIPMVWRHHQLENNRKYGGSLDLEALQQVPKQVSKFWAPLQEFPTFSRKVQFYCCGAQNFENLLGSLSQPIFWSKNRTQLEISVSKMGLMLPDLKNRSKSVNKNSVEKWNIMVLSMTTFFSSSLFLVNWHGSLWKQLFHVKS